MKPGDVREGQGGNINFMRIFKENKTLSKFYCGNPAHKLLERNKMTRRRMKEIEDPVIDALKNNRAMKDLRMCKSKV